jgi:hypothetical protein
MLGTKQFASNYLARKRGETMTKIQELQAKAAQAERLARSVLDTVTIERLMAFAAECRQKIHEKQLQTA